MPLNTQHKPAANFGPDRVDAFCSFTTNGTGAVTVLEQMGCSVARTGVGAFTITVTRRMRGTSKYHVLTQLEHTTTATGVPIVTTNSPSTNTVIVSMLATATPTESTGATIHVRISTRTVT